MKLQTHSGRMTLSDLSAELIREAEENLLAVPQKAEQILKDLELALDILTFSQSLETVPQGCNTSQLYYRTPIFKHSTDTSPKHPELRRCQKYAELRVESQGIVETQRLKMQYVKPKIVYISSRTIRNGSSP